MINGCGPYYTRMQSAVNAHLQVERLCQNRVFVYTLL